MTDTSKDAVDRLVLAMVRSGNTTAANMLTAIAVERDAANARADQALALAADVIDRDIKKIQPEMTRLGQRLADGKKPGFQYAIHRADLDARISCRDKILALRDKPAETTPQPALCSTSELQTAPAVTVDIDALAYRFWSIHPKDIPDPVGMPEGYKGGARAWMYATEIREAIRAIAGGGDE